MSLSFFPCLAACRTRPSAWVTRARPCVRCVLCPSVFLLVPALGSTGSAASGLDADALFADFAATMAECDFSRSCIIGFGTCLPDADRRASTETAQAVDTRDLPVPAQEASAHARVSDHAGPSGHSRVSRPSVLPSDFRTASAPRIRPFRGSMAGLCSPLSTLRRRPRERLRMTRGQCGSLLLHCGGLAPPTSCRSPGAHETGLAFQC